MTSAAAPLGGTMDAPTYAYAEGLKVFYEGEVLGEAIYSALLDAAVDPVERLKIAHLLQLETETKAWLRPYLISVGESVAEPLAVRAEGLAIAQAQPAAWADKMTALAEVIEAEFAALYSRYGDAARARNNPQEAAVCDFMVAHEMSQVEFARRDLAGEPLARVLEPLRRLSKHLLPLA
jgi:hypothetical protein